MRALLSEWSSLNQQRFDARMRPPQMQLIDTPGQLGRWAIDTRTLAIARHALVSLSWGQVIEVLKHEMAHQFVEEVLGVRHETAHGPTFQRICARYGVDPRAAGVPARSDAAADEGALGRIAKLLALAESPNEHEAQSAMRQAQRLMLKHNLDAVAAQHQRGYAFAQLGAPSGRVDEAARYVAVILNEYFFVEVIWVPVWRVLEGQAGSVLEVSGSVENLTMAEHGFSFLHHTADALWTLHKRRLNITGDRDRRAFRAGVMQGFREKLEAERRANEERGLVWVGDPALTAFYRSRHPRVVTVRRAGSGSDAARNAGRAEGKKLVLSKGVDGPSAGRGLTLGSGTRR
ncbi:MAG: DUF2786 domain-containing protein [Myxococcales bacterium]|nr:DUF2786 domain-containing protein [Myxococcales bacterium]